MSHQSRHKSRHDSAGHATHSQGYGSPSKNGVMGSSRSGSGGALLAPAARKRTSSNQGSRSNSPLMTDNVQTSPANSLSSYPLSHSHLDMGSPGLSPASRSPYQSPANSRSSSMTSVKSLLREREAATRSLERNMSPNYENTEHVHRSLKTGGARHRSMSRDRASDRYRDMDHYNTFSGRIRDRSLDRDRDYPHMGAKSLERDHMSSNLVRSRSIDYDYVNSQAAFLPAPQDFPHNSDTLFLDLQTHIAELNKECAMYQQELDLTQEKLGSSMNSIKTFWSPELKKERALRKEESAKIGSLSEQLRVAQAEKWKQLRMIEELEAKMRAVGQDSSDMNMLSMGTSPSSQIIHSLQQDKDRQSKEFLLLRKTIEEMELRIDTQKQTLNAREESIKKLLEMLQNKGMSVKHMDEDHQEIERCKLHVAEAERRVLQLEAMLEQRDNDIDRLRQNMRGVGNCDETNATVRIKELQNETLEMEVKQLQAEVKRLRLEGATNSDIGDQLELLRQDERDLQKKNDALKSNVMRKEKELSTLRSQVEVLDKQTCDQTQHITLLQNQIGAKDSQISLLQTEGGELRKAVQDRNDLYDQRASEVAALSSNKRQVDTQVTQLMETLDIKDRKISVLQRKIEKLEEGLADSEQQLISARSRLSSVQHETTTTDSTITQLQQTMQQQQQTIERMTEARRKAEEDHKNEMDDLMSSRQEIANRLHQLQNQLDQKQSSEMRLQESMGDLKTNTQKAEQEMKKLHEDLARKTHELTTLQQQVGHHRDSTSKQSQELTALQRQAAAQRDDISKKTQEIGSLLHQVDQYRDELAKKTQELTVVQRQHAQHTEELKKLKMNSTEKSGEVGDLRRQLAQSQEELQRLQRDLRHRSEETNSTKQTTSKQAQEIQQLRLESQEKSAEINRLVVELQQKDEKTRLKMGEVTKKVEEEVGKLNAEISKRTEEAKKCKVQADHKAAEVEQVKKQLAVVEKEKQRSLDQLGTEATKQADRLRQESDKHKQDAERSQAEMDRLLLILQESENEKRTMDKRIKTLQGQLKQHEESSESSGSKQGGTGNKKEEPTGSGEWQMRIEELEEALRESVKITAQRELVLAQQQDHIDMAEKQIEYLQDELERHKDQDSTHADELEDLKLQIDARDKQLKFLQGDRGKQMRELYEMKQEALSAAITEKDAHIALLEIAPNKKTENIDAVERLTFEKIKLQQQLKDLTEKRMKLLGLEEETKPNGRT